MRVRGRQPTTAEDIDAVVSAELPDCSGCTTGADPKDCPCDAHRLTRLITKSMVHKQCFAGRCYKQGTPESEQSCKYGFPFARTPVTHIDDRGRVRYKRTTDASARIVSYNAKLCLRFNAHINVDIVHTTM